MDKILLLIVFLSSCTPWVRAQEPAPPVRMFPAIVDVETIKFAQAQCLHNKGIKLIRINKNKDVLCANGAKFRMPAKEPETKEQSEVKE